jgi:hypothetical protein
LLSIIGCFAGSAPGPIAIADVVILAIEDRLAIVAALDHMQGLIWKKVAAKPGNRQFPPAGTNRTLPDGPEKIHSDPIYSSANAIGQRVLFECCGIDKALDHATPARRFD